MRAFTMPTAALSAFAWLLLCVLTTFLPSVVANDGRPNFVLLFCDDLGFGDLASYGHPYAVTPNLDRLAAQGTLFKQFHVNGNVCPVTRAGLMTSRNPSWFPNYTDDYGFLGTPTVMNFLQDAGYITGHIGKWNIGPDPADDAVDYPPYGISDLRITGSTRDDPRGREGLRFDEGIDFLQTYKGADRPFYLNMWLYATHTPVNPPPEILDTFLTDLQVDKSLFEGTLQDEKFAILEEVGADINEYMRIYLAEVYALDLQVGRFLDALEELGLADNTVVAFSSDNGPERTRVDRLEMLGYAGGLRGEKHSYYEGGTRVPFIVRWPGTVPAGRVDDRSIMFGTDWLTTVCALAGANVPSELVEGEDMSDVWKGASRPRRDPLLFRALKDHRKVHMRYGRWKLHLQQQELYDLETDPSETMNLYGFQPEVVKEMVRTIDAWVATLPDDHVRLPLEALPFDPAGPAPELVIPNLPDAFPGEDILLPSPSPMRTPTLRPADAPVTPPILPTSPPATDSPVLLPTRDPATPSVAPTSEPTKLPTSTATVVPLPTSAGTCSATLWRLTAGWIFLYHLAR